jgi:CBS domain-containing membrane protein
MFGSEVLAMDESFEGAREHDVVGSGSDGDQVSRQHEQPPPATALRELRGSLPRVRDLMSGSPIVLPTGVSAHDALAMMRVRRLRHAVVVNVEGDFVGLAHVEAVRATARIGGSIAHAAGDEVPSIVPSACAAVAASYMLRTHTEALPVIEEDGRLVGVLTETDFLRHAISEAEHAGCRCDIGSAEPKRLPSGARIRAIRAPIRM